MQELTACLGGWSFFLLVSIQLDQEFSLSLITTKRRNSSFGPHYTQCLSLPTNVYGTYMNYRCAFRRRLRTLIFFPKSLWRPSPATELGKRRDPFLYTKSSSSFTDLTRFPPQLFSCTSLALWLSKQSKSFRYQVNR